MARGTNHKGWVYDMHIGYSNDINYDKEIWPLINESINSEEFYSKMKKKFSEGELGWVRKK